MTIKPILEIHEILCDDIFNEPLETYVLTFDDGLYSQYYNYPKFKSIPTEKIYFISSSIVCNGPQSTDFIRSRPAHDKAFSGNFEDFMTIEQIKELMQDPLVSIGAHGHFHKDLTTIEKLADQVAHIKKDTELMVEWFKENLGFVPTKFCFPYNNNLNGLYEVILKRFGFTEFYGPGRVPTNLEW